MSPFTKPYGSRRRLLDWLHAHHQRLAREIADASEPVIGCPLFTWIDAGALGRIDESGARQPFETEWRGIDFLRDEQPRVWSRYKSEFWPRTGNVPNWDLIGRRETSTGPEWLLVEAKAHLWELDQACHAKSQSDGGSREVIADRLARVRADICPDNRNDWLAHYYQLANRLATLWFLLQQGIQARLLHLCFVGDEHFADAPHDAREWFVGRGSVKGLDAMDSWFGRPFKHSIESRLHVVCLNASPATMA